MTSMLLLFKIGVPNGLKLILFLQTALQFFHGPNVVPKLLYSDNSGELGLAIKLMGGIPDTCTPHVPQTNGIAENCVRKVKEGTACLLLQSGLSINFWDEAMKCFCFTRNVTDILACGCTAYQTRFGIEFNGFRVPFGAFVEYMPLREGKAIRDHPLGPKTKKRYLYGLPYPSWRYVV